MKRTYETSTCNNCGSVHTYDVTGWSKRVENIEEYEREGIGAAFWDEVQKTVFSEYEGLVCLVDGDNLSDGSLLDVYLFNRRQASDLGKICFDDNHHADGLKDGKVYLVEFVRGKDGQTVYELSKPSDIVDYLNGKTDGLKRIQYEI